MRPQGVRGARIANGMPPMLKFALLDASAEKDWLDELVNLHSCL